MSETAPPLVLIHGAWHAPWCWSRLIPLLEQAGREVHAPCLPGHDPARPASARIAMRHYQQAVADCLDALERPAILIGHSMAGMLIATLAETMPARISRLVFLNAFLPRDGDSIFSLMAMLDATRTPSIARHMQLSKDRLSYSLAPDIIAGFFYNRTPAALKAEACKRYCSQPSLPLAARVSLGNAYAGVAKTCVFSHNDHVIPLPLQRHMRRRQSCEEWLQLDCDHSPFFSAPEALAAILAEQA